MNSDEAKEFLKDNFGELPEKEEKKPEECNDVCIALLAYDGRMEVRTSACITQSSMRLAMAGRGVKIIHRDGDSMVARGRSFMASEFLQQPGLQSCSDLIFIDLDLSWDDPDALVRLCRYPVDVVGVLYPFKQAEAGFPHRWPWEGIKETKYGENGELRLWNMMGVVPGFLKISRRALTAIAKQRPWLEFYDKGATNKRAWMFFDNLARTSGVHDEGYVFCEHWQGIGGTAYIDPDIELTHIGKKAYNAGSFAKYLDGHADDLGRIMHEFPHVPDAIIAKSVLGGDSTIDLAKEEAKYAAEHQHGNAGTPGAAEVHGGEHPPEHEQGRYATVDLGGRGRQGDAGHPEAPTQGRSANGVGEAEGGQSWREVRQSLNGGPGGHLPAGG